MQFPAVQYPRVFRFLASDVSQVRSAGVRVPVTTLPSPPNGPSDSYPDGVAAVTVDAVR